MCSACCGRESLSRSELADRTGLTRAAMSLIVGELLVDGMVVEAARRKSAAGRRPVPVELNPEYAHSLGLTISRTVRKLVSRICADGYCAGVPIDIAGLTRQESLRAHESLLARPDAEACSAVGAGGLAWASVPPGPVDVAAGGHFESPELRDLAQCVPRRRDEEPRHRQCLSREQCAGAGPWQRRPSAPGASRKALFCLRSRQVSAAASSATTESIRAGGDSGNEIGHTSIDMNGPLCDCGLRGCVEMYASVPRVLAKAQKKNARIHKLARADGSRGHGRRILPALAEGAGTCLGKQPL